MSYPMLKWAACALFTLTPVAAAIAAETAPAKAEEVETITVTGSRLKGVDMEGAMPITVLDEDDIADSGAKSVIDLLKTLPQMGGGAATTIWWALTPTTCCGVASQVMSPSQRETVWMRMSSVSKLAMAPSIAEWRRCTCSWKTSAPRRLTALT